MPTTTTPAPLDTKTRPGPAELLTTLVRSLEGQYLRVIDTDRRVTVGKLVANEPGAPATLVRLHTISGIRYEVDLGDVEVIASTPDVPF